MRLPRVSIRKKQKEEYAFDNLSQEIEEVNEELEEVQETEHSEILLSEPDEEEKEKIKRKEYVIPEFYLSHEEKKSIEEDAFGDSDEELKEKNWEKSARESLEEIERIIDEGLIEKEDEEEVFEEDEEELEGAAEPGEQIYGKIINREVVYETPGGYVVKVISKEGGDIKTTYYSVSKVEGIEQALDDLQKYKPIIEEGTTPQATENKIENMDEESKKSFFDSILGKK